MMKVVFLSSYDPNSAKSWSGTPLYMLNALKKQNVEVVTLGPVKSRTLFFLKAVKLLLKLVNINYDYSYSKVLALEYAIIFRYKLKQVSDVDFIIAPAGSTQIAYLKTSVPIFYLSDTTYGQIKDYYENFKSLSAYSHAQGDKIEALALNNSSLVSFPSSWASNFAVKNYKLNNKVITINWGPNIDGDIMTNTKIKNKKPIILFLGVDWKRKGGDVALASVSILRKRYLIDANLIICGCNPDSLDIPDWVNVIGKLDKDNIAEREQLISLIKSCDVLLLPTVAECYGMVFCEAAAYGMPVIASKTGGIPSIVIDDVTGKLIDDYQNPERFAEALNSILRDEEKFIEISNRAKERYFSVLNWDAWAKNVIGKMDEFIKANK